MEFSEVVKNRYSCKKFDGRQIEKAQLEAILEAGRLAPTAKNLQEQRIYVIQSAEGLAKIDKATPCRYGAPTVLVVAFDKNNVFVYPGGKRNSGVEDAAIVATHMTLAAYNAGEGTVREWLGNTVFSEDGLTLKKIPYPETARYLKKIGKIKKFYDFFY